MTCQFLTVDNIRNFVENVVNLAAALADEVSVKADVAIVANSVLVDCYHLGSVVLREHSERVVYRGAAECRNLGKQCLVDLLHRWMSEVCHQVMHYLNTLNRGLYAVFYKSGYRVAVFHYLIALFITFAKIYNFIIITK